MSAKELKLVTKRLASEMSGFSHKGNLLFGCPVGEILRGISLEASYVVKGEFFVYAFFQPLFVPLKKLHFTFGFRLKTVEGRELWSFENTNLVAEIEYQIERHARAYLDSASSVAGSAEMLLKLRKLQNLNVNEAYAACLAFQGDVDGALKEWAHIQETTDTSVYWQLEILNRVNQVRERFLDNIETGHGLLQSWIEDTKRALKLG